MAYLALDDPDKLTRVDYARLAFAAGTGTEGLPFSKRYLRRFETDYCYDRYFEGTHREGWRTRIMCCGHAFVMTVMHVPHSSLTRNGACSANSVINTLCLVFWRTSTRPRS